MNKKVGKTKVVIDDKEDLEIRNIAHFKSNFQIILIILLIILFGFTLFSSLVYVEDYFFGKDRPAKNVEMITINNYDNDIFITNDGKIEKTISKKDIENKENIVIEKTNTIEFKTNKNSKDDKKILFDIKYSISENDFFINPVATNDSDVLVRFSYSFDNENWTYINNVITTNDSNLSPLMGNFYDISGLISDLKISTNYELTSKPGESVKMYWKSETFIQGKEDNLNKNLNAIFKIEYKLTT